MPKEQINYPFAVEHVGRPATVQAGDPISSPAVDGGIWYEHIVNVRWHAAGHDRSGNVQVSLQAPVNAWVQMADGLRQAEQNKTVEWEEGWMPEAYSPSLSRSEINQLIKVLRRARDQAYGRDE